MILTGKTLEQFKEWYCANAHEFMRDIMIAEFNVLPFSMQYGVLVDFFDSLGIIIDLEYQAAFKMFNIHIIGHKGGLYSENRINTRHEARRKAIEKANELNNKQNQ